MKLTAKQEMFCQEYTTDFNATRSAISAGYSKKTAYSQGQRLLKNVEIGKRLMELRKKLMDKVELSQERVVLELMRHAFFDIRKIYDQEGHLLPVLEWDDDSAACVAGIDLSVLKTTIEINDETAVKEVESSLLKKIKTTDALRALEMLGRHLAMFTDVKVIKGSNLDKLIAACTDD